MLVHFFFSGREGAIEFIVSGQQVQQRSIGGTMECFEMFAFDLGLQKSAPIDSDSADLKIATFF